MADKRDSGLHTGHRQRVKTRFKEHGLESFQEHEILEFLLFFGIPYKDTNEIAHKLIKKFGKFSEVFDASIEELKEIEGMTDNAAVLIKALPKIAVKYREDKSYNISNLTCLTQTIDYLRNLLFDATKEEFIMLSLDSQGNIIRTNRMNKGLVNNVQIDLRAIHEQALKDRAVSIVLAHNHPSHNPNPSTEDIEMTRKIIESLAHIDINVCDHVIVAGDKYYSFSRGGILDELKKKCPLFFLEKFAETNKKWLTE